MPEHAGSRRRWPDPQLARFLVLAAALAAIVWLLALPEPARAPAPGSAPTLRSVPTWTGPAPLRVAGRLPDGSEYQPRIFVTADTSIGVATDAVATRLVIWSGAAAVTELRVAAPGEVPQFDGFVVSADTLVWAESVSRPDDAVRTTLWLTDWRAGTTPRLITADTGETSFFGGQHDLVVQDGRVYWTSVATGDAPVTEVRSVALGGGRVQISRVAGEFTLTAWPWAVSVGTGRGSPIDLLNLANGERRAITTQAEEVVACSPAWCRMGVLGEHTLVGIDVQRPDGSQRHRIAGAEATPTIVDATLLDRFVPLATDHGEGGEVSIGLSLYDIEADRLDLVAVDVANIQGRNGILWWSTGSGAALAWHALDLRVLG